MVQEMHDAEGSVDPTAPMETLTVQDTDHRSEEAPADLLVPFKIALDAGTGAAMVAALAKYLLYLRGQIPCVYEEFHTLVSRRREAEEAVRAAGSRKRKLVGGTAKKAEKIVDQVHQTLDTSLRVLFQRRVRAVVIVFGSSIASPRELWRVDFHGDVDHDAASGHREVTGKEGAALPRDRVERLCVQKIIRTLLSYATQHFSSPLSVTATHLLVLAEATDIPVEGFVPKQQLRLRVPKAKKEKRMHRIDVQHESGQTVDSRDPTFLWYQSARPLLGVSRLV